MSTNPVKGPVAVSVRHYAYHFVRIVGEFFEDQWFDRSRNIRTSWNASLKASGLNQQQFGDSEFYMPARPRHIRQALRAMPIKGVSAYTYVDLGSGKGRSLFVAAEWPFQQIIGVELSPRLHAQASDNVHRFRACKPGCKNILALQQNATEFVFPSGRLVLYMFNPFGAETMHQVLSHLQAALEREQEHVVVILLWPRCADLVLQLPGMRLTSEAREYQIFEAKSGAERR